MNRRRNQEENEAQASPYRMGNWTVTMLKDELRVRQLPTSGRKAELLDRLETGTESPKSPTRKSNLSPKSRPRSTMVEKQIETSPSKELAFDPKLYASRSAKEERNSPSKTSSTASPSKSLLAGLAEIGNPFLESSGRRGRSHFRNTFTASQMTTRSRSRSMSRGTYLQWTTAPHTILANFFMQGIEETSKQFKNRPLVLLTSLTLFAVVCTLAYLDPTKQAFATAVKVLTPFAVLFASGLKEAFGFGSFNFSLVHFAASSMVLLKSFGVKGFKKHMLQGAAHSYGLWGVIAAHVAYYTAGSLAGSFALYWIAQKCRHNTFFTTNARFRFWLNLAAKQFFLTAALPNFLLGLDGAGLMAGFAGLSQAQFWGGLVAGRAIFGIPTRLAYSSFWADASVFEMILTSLSSNIPSLKAPIQLVAESVQFIRQSSLFLQALKYAHLLSLAYLSACFIKAVANARAYNQFRPARR